MNNLGKNLFDIGYMDALAKGSSPLHRLDPRAKLITTFLFVVSIVSFDKYALSALIPFFIYPAALIAIGEIPVKYIVKKGLLVSPFAIAVGIFNPIMNREILFHVGSLGVSGGWISFFSILLRFALTVSAVMILIALTGFNQVCSGLLKLRIPRLLVLQLIFFHRYIFVLTDEAERLIRAMTLKTFGSPVMRFKNFILILGHLLLRTIDRAERIYQAMCCRGFDGHIPVLRQRKIHYQEILFVLGWSGLFILLRVMNLPLKLGLLITRGFQ